MRVCDRERLSPEGAQEHHREPGLPRQRPAGARAARGPARASAHAGVGVVGPRGGARGPPAGRAADRGRAHPGPVMTRPAWVTGRPAPMMIRMDDVGAASKRHEVYGRTRLSVGPVRVPFPGNLLWLKYLPPIKRWGPYRELTASEWHGILETLTASGARMTVGVTAAWVEDDGRLTPFPRKFPDAARAIREGVDARLLEVANHGLTHCLLENRAFRPRLWAGNRSYHREFYEFVPAEAQEIGRASCRERV